MQRPLLPRRVVPSKVACIPASFSALLGAMRIPQGWIPVLPERVTMVPFFVQFKCKLGQSYAVANALAEAEIASEIYSTAGDYDLLVKFYVDSDTDIGHFINEKVQVIPGIQDTHTIITFKAFGTS
jgi:DNA-binding Lrp family transcriptional regulator